MLNSCFQDLEGIWVAEKATKGANVTSALPLWIVWLRGNPAAVLRVNPFQPVFPERLYSSLFLPLYPKPASMKWEAEGRGSSTRERKALCRLLRRCRVCMGFEFFTLVRMNECSEYNQRKYFTLVTSPRILYWKEYENIEVFDFLKC